MATPVTDVTLAPPHHQHLHPGLGTLSKLPVELRLMIWHECLPKADFPHCRHRVCIHEHSKQPASPVNCGTLSILRASRDLYREVSGELYRVLTVCINMRTPRGKIWPIHSISDYRGQTSFTRVGNTCKITDLSRIDLSKFERLHVDIQLPTGKKEGWSNRVESLTSGMKVFAKEVRKQQLLAKKGPAPWRPDIDVVIADCDPDRRTDPLSKFVYWEIYDVLDPLKVISDAKSVKIDVRVDMGFEQEFLQESIDGLVEDMRRRDGENGWSTYRAAIAKD